MMTEEPMMDLRPVLLKGLQDEKYPRYNFLKKRLLSIYPRFKTCDFSFIEKFSFSKFTANLRIKQLTQRLDDVVDSLKDELQLILMGSFEKPLNDKQFLNSIIASSRCRFGDDAKIEETVFELDEIKNIISGPVVIVYGVPPKGDTEKSFRDVTHYMLNEIPEEGLKSFVLCNERFGKYITIQDFIDAGECLSTQNEVHNTLGNRVQACLEGKVVVVLHEMLDYIQRVISPELDVSEIKREELSKTLQQAIQEIQGGRIEDETCENLSRKWGVDKKLMKRMYADAGLGESILKDVEVIQEYFEKINRSLVDYESKSLEIFDSLSMIDFEIKGVLRQAQYPVSSMPDISKALQDSILSISGVNGCGLMLGKLVVHIKEGSPVDEKGITKKVMSILMKSDQQYFVSRLQVKRIRLSNNAKGTFESGHRLCVNGSFGQAAGDIYGTLGCFVKGKSIGSSSEQLYALSCAHVFPDGCNEVVRVARGNLHDTLEILGHINHPFKLLRDHKVDIAAIAVTQDAKQNCLHSLKNSDNCDVWKSALHEGDLNAILGFQVYKWGAKSDFTRGLICSVNYANLGFDSQFNVFIKSESESSEPFSSEGDSGSAVCFDEPSEETVQVLSLVNGEITAIATGKHECSYTVHLKKNLEELSKQSGHSYELYNPDQLEDS